MPNRRCLAAVVLVAALVPCSSSVAQAQVTGPDDGVRAVKGPDSDLVLRFSKKAAKTYRQIAGKRVTVGCGRVEKLGGGYVSVGTMTTVTRAPKRRRAIRTFSSGPDDYCFVKSRGRSRGLVALVPVSEAGRIWWTEMVTAGWLTIPSLFTDDGKPAGVEEVVAATKGFVVALDGPDGSPPIGKVGYWTDGNRMVVAAVTPQGRRLFIDTEGDVVRTNVLIYLNQDI